MKRVIGGIALSFALGCGGTGYYSSRNVLLFRGSWSATLATSVLCPGQIPQQSTIGTTLNLGNGSGADLQYTSQDGCLYKFNVSESGTTASLVNGPVTCSGTTSSGAVLSVTTRYTLTTGDGHNLTATAFGTVPSAGANCTFSMTVSGWR